MNPANETTKGHDNLIQPCISIFSVLCFLLVCLVPFALDWDTAKRLWDLVLNDDTFSQIPLIPVVSLYLVYESHRKVFAAGSSNWILGLALIIPGLILMGVGRFNLWHLSDVNLVSLLMLAMVIIWLGAFVSFFGSRAFSAACFPLLFLFFMVPIPEPALSKIIYFLQAGSSQMTEIFFRIAGVPFLRQGFEFQLPGVAIRVAEECSGIRSSLALFITTVLASRFFLQTNWRRIVLCLFVVPVVVFKNGLRIATLTLLSIYVNPGFLTGKLHRQGGFVFFIIALIPMALLLKLLQKGEVPPTSTGPIDHSEHLQNRISA